MRRSLGSLVALLVVLVAGGALTYGGFSIWQDQHSGVPGKARVSECQGGVGKYQRGIYCRGSWITGGDLVFGNGHVAVGRIEGAAKGDVGKTIDVRIHGRDHATKPSIGTPILLWVLGGPVTLLALFGIFSWWRGPRSA